VSFLPEAGARLDRYDLLYEVGRGGMGSVWAARLRGKHGFEKLVAIKTILPEFAADPRFRALLLNEARITAKIEHPNVVQTFELGEHHGALYVVMEWIDGASLDVLQNEAAHTDGRAVPLGVALRVIADVCAGLHAAHDMRDEGGRLVSILHGDISPHNILVSARGTIKLADFGLAKVHDQVMARAAEMPSLRGKMRYMAPERASGRPEDRRSDIWSLGAVLQELLPKDIPGVCTRVVRRALEPARERRFPTALEFARAIESAMDDCDLTTTSADVASFFEPIVRKRSAARREKLETTAAMDATLDVASDLRTRASAAPIDGAVEATEPMNRTLFVQGLRHASALRTTEIAPLADPHQSVRRRLRVAGLLVVAVVAVAAVVTAALGARYVLGPMARGPAAADSAPALDPANAAAMPSEASSRGAPAAGIAAPSEPSAKAAPVGKPSAPARSARPAAAKPAPAKTDPYDGRQ